MNTTNLTSNSNTEETARLPRKIDKKERLLLKIKRKLFSHPRVIRKILMILLLIVVGIILLSFVKTIIKTKSPEYVSVMKGFIFTNTAKIETYKGRLNILVMGKSGFGNDSPDLTDSMMLVSVGITKPSLLLISLPRDIWIPSIRAKINSAYYWGNQKEKGGGLILAKNLAEEIVGVPVEYSAVFDFSVFKDVIDTLGGIEVNVENSFTDEKYPIKGKESMDCPDDEGKQELKKEYKCRYETISFEKGKVIMNGDAALKFSRSRNAAGDEGTDLAREKRQQKVITAIKDKLLSTNTLLNPKKLWALKDIALTSIETDMDTTSLGVVGRRVLVGRKDIRSYVLGEDFLEHPPISQRYDYQYVFTPKAGNWDEVKKWVESLY
jgi:polyisoprenyl-teichoic acid--peptidoglycan teichoic acid transferase